MKFNDKKTGFGSPSFSVKFFALQKAVENYLRLAIPTITQAAFSIEGTGTNS